MAAEVQDIVRRGYLSPRWLFEEITVPAKSEINLPPSAFENETIFKMKLVNLTFTSPRRNWTSGRTFGDVNTGAGMWHRQIEVEIGKTQCSDQNLVRGSISTLGANPYIQRQKFYAFVFGRDARLPTPYRLPRDCGLTVTVANTAYTDQTQTTRRLTRATFVAKGREEPTGRPVFLAGDTTSTINPGDQVTLESADLYNRGRRELWIDRIGMSDYMVFSTGVGAYVYDTSGTWVSWLVNPTWGQAWMPQNRPIPVGNLCPMARAGDYRDQSPKSYYFPQDTYLYPRQRIGVKLTNRGSTAVPLFVSLHAELEVQ